MNIPKAPRYVVCGPPGCGKTTYVYEHAQPRDLVWDFDRVAAMLTVGLESARGVELDADMVRLVNTLRDTLCHWVAQRPDLQFAIYVICANALLAQRIAGTIGGDLVWKDGDAWKVTTIKRAI